MPEISGVAEWDNGNPIEGALVTARLGTEQGPEVATTTTAADGSYTLQVRQPATYHVKCQYEADDGARHNTYSKPYISVASSADVPAFWSEAVHRYEFHEGSGTAVADTGPAAPAANLTLSGATWTTSNYVHEGAAVEFSGTDQYAEAANQASMSGFQNGLTVLGWWYPRANTGRNTLAGVYDTAADQRSWHIEQRNSLDPPVLQIVISDDGVNLDYYRWDEVWTGEWRRLAFRWEPDTRADLFVNGTQSTRVYDGGTLPSLFQSSAQLRLSSPLFDSRFYNAIFDDLLIVPRAVSDQELVEDFNAYTVP